MSVLLPPAGNQFLPLDVFNTAATCPAEGAKCVPVVVDFTSVTNQPAWTLDLTNLINQSKMKFVQALYIDNSANAAAVTVQSVQSGQRITLPANSQGYLPFLQPNPPQLTITSTPAAGLYVPIYLLNFPVDSLIWKTQ